MAAPDPIENEAEPAPPVDPHGTGVLAVEDKAEVGPFAVQTLTGLGYRTVPASDAAEALAELAEDAGRFDKVFTDVIMRGIRLGQEIRRRDQNLPVLLAAGNGHVPARNGTDGFELLHGPHSVAALSRPLRKVAARQRGRLIVGP